MQVLLNIKVNDKGNLEITATPEGIEYLQDQDSGSSANFPGYIWKQSNVVMWSDLLESFSCNGSYNLAPDGTFALTEAPIIAGEPQDYDDMTENNPIVMYPANTKFWAFTDYMVIDEMKKLLEGETVTFIAVPEDTAEPEVINPAFVIKTATTEGVSRKELTIDKPLVRTTTEHTHNSGTWAMESIYEVAKNVINGFYIIPDANCIYKIIAPDQTREFYYDGTKFSVCNTFTCDCCKKEKYYISDFTTGYGTDKTDKKMCYECIAVDEFQLLINAPFGFVKTVTLYYNSKENTVCNWPASMVFKTYNNSKGKHNIARYRYDFDFKVSDCKYHGYVCGDNNQIATIRKVKH